MSQLRAKSLMTRMIRTFNWCEEITQIEKYTKQKLYYKQLYDKEID